MREGGGFGGERVRIKNHEKKVEREKLEERERERGRDEARSPLQCIFCLSKKRNPRI